MRRPQNIPRLFEAIAHFPFSLPWLHSQFLTANKIRRKIFRPIDPRENVFFLFKAKMTTTAVADDTIMSKTNRLTKREREREMFIFNSNQMDNRAYDFVQYNWIIFRYAKVKQGPLYLWLQICVSVYSVSLSTQIRCDFNFIFIERWNIIGFINVRKCDRMLCKFVSYYFSTLKSAYLFLYRKMNRAI